MPPWNGWDTHQADFATRRGCHPSSPAPASSERRPKARVQLQSREGDAEALEMPARLCQLQRDVEHRLQVRLRGLQSIMVRWPARHARRRPGRAPRAAAGHRKPSGPLRLRHASQPYVHGDPPRAPILPLAHGPVQGNTGKRKSESTGIVIESQPASKPSAPGVDCRSRNSGQGDLDPDRHIVRNEQVVPSLTNVHNPWRPDFDVLARPFHSIPQDSVEVCITPSLAIRMTSIRLGEGNPSQRELGRPAEGSERQVSGGQNRQTRENRKMPNEANPRNRSNPL